MTVIELLDSEGPPWAPSALSYNLCDSWVLLQHSRHDFARKLLVLSWGPWLGGWTATDTKIEATRTGLGCGLAIDIASPDELLRHCTWLLEGAGVTTRGSWGLQAQPGSLSGPLEFVRGP